MLPKYDVRNWTQRDHSQKLHLADRQDIPSRAACCRVRSLHSLRRHSMDLGAPNLIASPKTSRTLDRTSRHRSVKHSPKETLHNSAACVLAVSPA